MPRPKADLTLDLVADGQCLCTHAQAASTFVFNVNTSDLKNHGMIGLVYAFGADDNLPSLAAGLVVFQLGCHGLVVGAHDIAHGCFTVTNLFTPVYVDIPNVEAELLLLFKGIVELEAPLEIRVQIVVDLFSFTEFDPRPPPIIPGEHVNDWITL